MIFFKLEITITKLDKKYTFFNFRFTDVSFWRKQNFIFTIVLGHTIFISFPAFIEKNTWSGLEDFYSNLASALHVEISTKARGSKSRRRNKTKKIIKSNLSNSINGNISNGENDEEIGETFGHNVGKYVLSILVFKTL